VCRAPSKPVSKCHRMTSAQTSSSDDMSSDDDDVSSDDSDNNSSDEEEEETSQVVSISVEPVPSLSDINDDQPTAIDSVTKVI